MDHLLTAAAVVTPERVLRPGWIRTSGSQLVEVAAGVPTDVPTWALGEHVLVPGFVDVHCHGGGGSSFGVLPEASAAAASAHLRHGTTSLLASLVSGPLERLLEEIHALEPLVEDGRLAGIHLEGPWLSPAQCGAHDRHQLRPPARDEVSKLLDHSALRMVTVAPELEGALEAIRRIVDAGAVAAIGHTDADHATTRRAIDAGARHATHLFNAMRPFRHRDPGPVLALLEDEAVTVELIRDGVHVDLKLCAWLDATLPPDRLVAVTDAMAAAGAGDGRYALGGRDVSVVDGVARVVGSSTIAGSTATMDALFRAVAGTAPSDEDLLRAVRQTAANPARALDLAGVGALTTGSRADLVVLDAATLAVRQVLREGAWVAPEDAGGPQVTN